MHEHIERLVQRDWVLGLGEDSEREESTDNDESGEDEN
jgi:hypothetical protein